MKKLISKVLSVIVFMSVVLPPTSTVFAGGAIDNNIHVVNYAGIPDIVTVTGLEVGDVVKVYSIDRQDGATPLIVEPVLKVNSKKKVKSNIKVTEEISGTQKIIKLEAVKKEIGKAIAKADKGAKGTTQTASAQVSTQFPAVEGSVYAKDRAVGSIYVTVTRKGLSESVLTEVEYLAEQRTSKPTNISIENYAGMQDIVKVEDLEVGDIVKVYSESSGLDEVREQSKPMEKEIDEKGKSEVDRLRSVLDAVKEKRDYIIGVAGEGTEVGQIPMPVSPVPPSLSGVDYMKDFEKAITDVGEVRTLAYNAATAVAVAEAAEAVLAATDRNKKASEYRAAEVTAKAVYDADNTVAKKEAWEAAKVVANKAVSLATDSAISTTVMNCKYDTIVPIQNLAIKVKAVLEAERIATAKAIAEATAKAEKVSKEAEALSKAAIEAVISATDAEEADAKAAAAAAAVAEAAAKRAETSVVVAGKAADQIIIDALDEVKAAELQVTTYKENIAVISTVDLLTGAVNRLAKLGTQVIIRATTYFENKLNKDISVGAVIGTGAAKADKAVKGGTPITKGAKATATALISIKQLPQKYELYDRRGNIYITVTKKGKLESEKFGPVSYEKERKTPIPTSIVTIINNALIPDVVTVKSLNIGDIVNIYKKETIAGTATYILQGTGIAKVDKAAKGTAKGAIVTATATVNIKQLGEEAGEIYVTVTNKGKLESDRSEPIKYYPEGQTSFPTVTPLH